MAWCKHCRRHYREPEDEQGDHPCPKCRRYPHERHVGRETSNGGMMDATDTLLKSIWVCPQFTGLHEAKKADWDCVCFGIERLCRGDHAGQWS